MTERLRILFFGEPVTAAHVVRPLALASALDAARYDAAIATGGAYAHYADAAGIARRTLWSIGSERFLERVARGRPVFAPHDLEQAVEDDLAHIEAFAPHAVVGDFRLSLAVSARIARVPYLAIANAYWSPQARPRFEIPVHPLSRLAGPDAASSVFRAVRPLIFAQHAWPMHRARRRRRLDSLGLDLRRVFTESDLTLYADAAELVPLRIDGGRANARFLGAVHWSAPAPLPPSLLAADARPLAYIALGSSGDPEDAVRCAQAAADAGCRVAVATGGRIDPAALPRDAVSAALLPGARLVPRAAVVACNGGSPACQQALAAGVPVLGVPANLDQLLNMHYVERAGAGLAVRPERATRTVLAAAFAKLLHDPALRRGAAYARDVYARYDAAAILRDALETVVLPPAASGGRHG